MFDQDSGDRSLTAARERELIRQAQAGCARSAHALVVAHQDRLHAFVWRMARNDHDAEEICQDAFLRAFEALDRFNFSYRFSTWLFTIAYRLFLNAVRRRRDYAGDVDFSGYASNGRADAAESVADQVASSDEARRLREIIWDSVEKLTPQQKAAVLLFYRETMSCEEIGRVMGIPGATVKSHLHRARNRLKEMLSSELVDDWSALTFREAMGTA